MSTCPECDGPLRRGRFCPECGWDVDLDDSEDAYLDGLDLGEADDGASRGARPTSRRWEQLVAVTAAALLVWWILRELGLP